jgi:aspartate aminotransferase
LSPFYPNYMSFAKQSGVVLNSVKRTIENGFHLPSIEEIEKKINSKTRALLFSNPCNPTGVVFYKEEIEALIDLCEKHDLFLISDEVYYEISFKHQTTSALDFLKGASRVIVVDSVSKKFSLCGTRIGALISRNPLIVAAGTSYASARLSAPTLEQKALIPLFKEAEKVIAPIVNIFSKRNKNLYQRIKKIQGVEAYEAEGALYLFCQLPVISSSNFCRWLVEEYAYKGHTVVLAPGYGFYQDYSEGCSKIRIANVLDTELLLESMTIIEKGLEVYPDY